jgi:Putative Ig domain
VVPTVPADPPAPVAPIPIVPPLPTPPAPAPSVPAVIQPRVAPVSVVTAAGQVATLAQVSAQLLGVEPGSVAATLAVGEQAAGTRVQAQAARNTTPTAALSTTVVADAAGAVSLSATRDAGSSFFYAVPCGPLQICEPQGKPKLLARAEDGAALPDWLKFDADSATFFGTAPTKARQLKVRITTMAAVGGKSVQLILNFAGGKAVP